MRCLGEHWQNVAGADYSDISVSTTVFHNVIRKSSGNCDCRKAREVMKIMKINYRSRNDSRLIDGTLLFERVS